MKKFTQFGFIAFVLASVALGSVSAALTNTPLPTGPTSEAQLFTLIETGLNYVFTAFLIVAVIFIILAAFNFVMGGTKGAEEGRQKLMWAVVGIAIAVAAKGIPTVIRSLVPGGS